jgi:hypothetical protein
MTDAREDVAVEVDRALEVRDAQNRWSDVGRGAMFV